MDTYQATSLALKGDWVHCSGGATDHGDTVQGAVTVYATDGNVSIRAESPDVLRQVAEAFADAADRAEAMTAERLRRGYAVLHEGGEVPA